MSLTTSLLKHSAKAAAAVLIGVLRDATSTGMQRIADLLDPKARLPAAPRYDALAAAAGSSPGAAVPDWDAESASGPSQTTQVVGALVGAAIIGAGIGALLAKRRP